MGAEFDQRARLECLDEPERKRNMAIPRADDASPGCYGEEGVLRRVDQPVEGVVGQELLQGLRRGVIAVHGRAGLAKPRVGHKRRLRVRRRACLIA